ncbi:hypothetical protein ALC53_13254 [Atta colombica]|uniref:Uncharacterized protein n=1 Tax=Atta colombica TaxID=520822 RepID=A0A195AVZ1_9HYME|nr:hypothetical protein ALC53_13254 [Atta colombica]
MILERLVMDAPTSPSHNKESFGKLACQTITGTWRTDASPSYAYLLLSSAASGVQGFLSSRQPTYPFNSLSLLNIASTSTLSNFVVYISSARTEEDERTHTVIKMRYLIVPERL